MEKRFLAAFALSILILLGWSVVYKKLAPPRPPAPPAPVSTVPAVPSAAGSADPSLAGTAPLEAAPRGDADTHPGAAPAEPAVGSATEDEVRVETEFAEILLTNRGGRARSWKLKNFRSAGKPLDLVSRQARDADILPLSLVFDDATLLPGINAQLFRADRSTDAAGATRVSFRWSDGHGTEVEKSFTFRPDDPLVDVAIRVLDRGRPVSSRLAWGPGFEVEDPEERSNTYYQGQAVVYDTRVVGRIPRSKIDETTTVPESAPLAWAGLEDQYFTALILPSGGRGGATIAPLAQSGLAIVGKPLPAELAEAPTISVGLPEGRGQLFAGPKSFRLLSTLGHDLEKAVWFSSYSLIYACAKPLFLALRWVHDHWFANYGVAIVLLTIALRVVLFPLNQYSMVKMRRMGVEMQRIQPKLKAIQAKYKKSKDPDARAKMNTETMELYKREGVNPFGTVSGCLPLFIQMPILWAFFDVLTAAVELRAAPFFAWIQDLTHPDPYWITPILMGVTMFVQQKMTPTATMDPAQQRMMLFMPLIFTVMFGSLPSGLVLYYFVNNLLGIGQQWLVNRHIERLDTAPAKA